MSGKFKPELGPLGYTGIVFTAAGLFLTAIILIIAHAMRTGAADNSRDAVALKWVFLGFGLLFMFAGTRILFTEIRRMRRQRHAYETGTAVYAVFDHCEADPRLRGRGRNPVYAVLRETDVFGETREYRSNSMWQDPAAQLAGKLVPVYVDADNPENYYVDLQSVLG